MQFSAPIYHLKRQARQISRTQQIPLHAALDQVAQAEGYQSWSHLVSAPSRRKPVDQILSQLEAGSLVLLGARPGQGKTSLGLELALRADRIGRSGLFMTLEYNAADVAALAQSLGVQGPDMSKRVSVDMSDDISAPYIIDRVRAQEHPMLVVVDYLQLMDQKRVSPPLNDQVESLHRFAKETGTIFAMISQIDRAFDLSGRPMPDVTDVRLPNPLEMALFDRFCFLHDSQIRLSKAA